VRDGERPLRICFVAYRGNMACGGQGIYLWFLARELARLGHAVDVLVGPPWPDAMPFAGSVERIPNEMFWGKWFLHDWKNLLPRPQPLRVFEPLNFYEFAAARMGFLPEPFAFSVRAFRALAARLRAGRRYDVVHDVQSLGYGLLGIRALGLPVVTTVHHPLSVDRATSFARDRTLREAFGTWEFYPVEMQAFVARRLERVFTSSEVSARRIQRDFRVPPERLAMVANGLDTDLFSPDPAVAKAPAELLCVGRASDPNKGVRTLVAALARLPETVTLTLVDDPASEALRWAREAGCAHRLHVTGRVETATLVALYRRATLVVVPSRFEGFGLSAQEFEFIRSLPVHSRCFLVRQANRSVVVRLDLSGMPDVLTVLSGRESSVRRLDELRASVGDDPAHWYPLLTRAQWPGAASTDDFWLEAAE
jgi:glycosyltransferase involved in cell wall biosynthesis